MPSPKAGPARASCCAATRQRGSQQRDQQLERRRHRHRRPTNWTGNMDLRIGQTFKRTWEAWQNQHPTATDRRRHHAWQRPALPPRGPARLEGHRQLPVLGAVRPDHLLHPHHQGHLPPLGQRHRYAGAGLPLGRLPGAALQQHQHRHVLPGWHHARPARQRPSTRRARPSSRSASRTTSPTPTSAAVRQRTNAATSARSTSPATARAGPRSGTTPPSAPRT